MFCVLSACDAKLATNGMLSHGQGARGEGGHAAAAAFAYLQKPAAPTGHGQRLCVCYAAPQLRHCLLSVAESGQHGMGTVKLAREGRRRSGRWQWRGVEWAALRVRLVCA